MLAYSHVKYKSQYWIVAAASLFCTNLIQAFSYKALVAVISDLKVSGTSW